ncbi:hypothetical protein LTR37_011388 [Vermiconidia calcicola]|uniref:Uncharacterized protein n=1 Tax=Vermiconidia calcicola TaxID=1690605 RepID=A0ACC3N2B3_9PEZI|nr:hypothetical protein LTR37_011388 [Vermiconidia calcicola]
MAVASAAELQPVVNVAGRLQALLDLARSLKPPTAVETALPIAGILPEVSALHDDFSDDYDQTYRYSAVETAARKIFYSLISSIDIQDSAFVQVWNLLDILTLCGDRGICTPELVCWLIEELLDSQTTHGCRTVFDYLESRRERLAQKDFHKKNLVFLRSCNELLRRLSRAEDAIFCGRVFFFLFQTFPLGDKSSVNLRGEFHVENTTKFEVTGSQPEQDGEKIEVDSTPAKAEAETPKASTPQPPTKPGAKAVPAKAPPKKEEEIVLSNNDLYPVFWRLQKDFSDPTRLFAARNFQAFKKGLVNTITKFKRTPTVVQTQAAEAGKRGTKRKLGSAGNDDTNRANIDHFAENYNPKYLTSRELFDLELSDLAFQRHILVQTLILVDFLLSLTEKAKKRLASLETTNKSMLYNFTLSEEDAKWATATRQTITAYLSATHEGKLFNRMVDTVLARDKNWIRWKVESCPSIVRDPVSTESELEARKGAREATRIRRMPERPMGTMDLSFLDEGSVGGLEALKDPARYTAPSITELIDGIQTDQLDLEMAMDEGETMSLQNAMANKRWRAVRQARANQLGVLDKIEPGKDLDPVFRPKSEPEVAKMEGEPNGDAGLGSPGENETAAPELAVTIKDDAGAQTQIAEQASENDKAGQAVI